MTEDSSIAFVSGWGLCLPIRRLSGAAFDFRLIMIRAGSGGQDIGFRNTGAVEAPEYVTVPIGQGQKKAPRVGGAP